MESYTTQFGSLKSYQKGGVQVIADRVENYAFSNVFEICSSARPYERVVFGLNQIYVLEAVRAEGHSPWFLCAHDEFVLCMDGAARIDLVEVDVPRLPEDKLGAVSLPNPPEGTPMGWIRIQRGHQALLPSQCAYRFDSATPSVLVIQTCKGDLSVERWAEICQRTGAAEEAEGGR